MQVFCEGVNAPEVADVHDLHLHQYAVSPVQKVPAWSWNPGCSCGVKKVIRQHHAELYQDDLA